VGLIHHHHLLLLLILLLLLVALSNNMPHLGWLIRQDLPNDAPKSLLRLTSKGTGALSVDEIVEMMKHTNEVQKYRGNGKITYLNCFRGVDLWRTEITIMV
jgi:SP family general alpha glucoside:H+ symporter-like MFS transporter